MTKLEIVIEFEDEDEMLGYVCDLLKMAFELNVNGKDASTLISLAYKILWSYR